MSLIDVFLDKLYFLLGIIIFLVVDLRSGPSVEGVKIWPVF